MENYFKMYIFDPLEYTQEIKLSQVMILESEFTK